MALNSQRNAKRSFQELDLKNAVQSQKLARGFGHHNRKPKEELVGGGNKPDFIAIDCSQMNNHNDQPNNKQKDERSQKDILLLKNMSPRLARGNTLKGSQNIIKREENFLNLSVEAKKIEDEYQDERIYSERKSRHALNSFENTSMAQSQIIKQAKP